MLETEKHCIEVKTQVRYLAGQSDPERHHHVFAYTITVNNLGQVAAKLLSRHWYITDANGKVKEVQGEGVVGEQPRLNPGEKFQYTSYAVISTPVGSMHGSYQMVADDGICFDANIPAFTLANPAIIH